MQKNIGAWSKLFYKQTGLLYNQDTKDNQTEDITRSMGHIW